MSVFRNIMSRIFRGSTLAPAAAAGTAAAATAGAPVTAPAEASSAAQPAAAPGPAMAPPAPVAAPATASAAAAPSVTPAASAPVDVEAVLTEMAGRNPQKLNWRTSIVDLMKLLDLDSSLAARKELAEELGYTGAKDGSAEMNTWLHRAVMRKLAENGGRVPEELKS